MLWFCLLTSFLSTSFLIFCISGSKADNPVLPIALTPSKVDSPVCTIVSSMECQKNNKTGFKMPTIVSGNNLRACKIFIKIINTSKNTKIY